MQPSLPVPCRGVHLKCSMAECTFTGQPAQPPKLSQCSEPQPMHNKTGAALLHHLANLPSPRPHPTIVGGNFPVTTAQPLSVEHDFCMTQGSSSSRAQQPCCMRCDPWTNPPDLRQAWALGTVARQWRSCAAWWFGLQARAANQHRGYSLSDCWDSTMIVWCSTLSDCVSRATGVSRHDMS